MKDIFGRNRRLVFLFIVLALSFLTLSLNSPRPRFSPSPLGLADKGLMWLVSPFQQAAAGLGAMAEAVWYNYIYLVKLREKNRLLERRLSQVSAELNALREKAVAADRLAELLRFKLNHPYDLTVARIIGADAGSFHTMTIDRGEYDDVKIGAAVVAAGGVVGRVVKVHPVYAQVLALIDYNSAIDAIIQRSRDKGIVVGMGGTTCEMKYIDRQADVQVDDTVVTSGTGGMFPPGLVIGRVTEVEKEGPGLFQSVKIKPAVELATLEEVFLIREEKP